MYPSELVGIDSLELLWEKLETPFGRMLEEESEKSLWLGALEFSSQAIKKVADRSIAQPIFF